MYGGSNALIYPSIYLNLFTFLISSIAFEAITTPPPSPPLQSNPSTHLSSYGGREGGGGEGREGREERGGGKGISRFFMKHYFIILRVFSMTPPLNIYTSSLPRTLM